MTLLVLSIALLIVLSLAVYAMTRQNAIQQEIQNLVELGNPHQIYAEYKKNHRALNLYVLGGILLTGGFALTFFGGGTIEINTWNADQQFFGFVGIVATIAVTFGQRSLYRNINQNIPALLVTVLILSFVIFSEVSTTSEREASIVRDRSLASPTYQALVQNIATPDSQAISAPNTGYLAQYLATEKANLENCKTEACRQITQAKISSYQANITQRQLDYQQTIEARRADKLAFADQAAKLEYNEQNHSASIRFIKEQSGVTFAAAMMFAALIFVIAFESGFHFTGTKEGIYIEALARLGYSVNNKPSLPNLTPSPTPKNRIPKQDTDEPTHTTTHQNHPSTHTTDHHVHAPKTTTETPKNPNPQTYASSRQLDDMNTFYEIAKNAKAGEQINCPNCAKPFTKKTYNQTFCSKPCKESFWNTVKPERRMRT